MKRYALVNNNVVDNIIESETQPLPEFGNWIECPLQTHMKSTYDPATKKFTAPIIAEETPKRYISVGAFFDRFKTQKYPILSSTNIGVQALIKDCSVRRYIDLDNAELPYGLDMLIAAGFTINKEAILTDVITESEKV